jgi:hypothetical protein
MKDLIARLLIWGVPLAMMAPAKANPINVTGSSLVTLGSNDSLLFYISSNSPYPGEIELVLGGIPLGGPVESISGTSVVYMPGMLFSGTLESQDGSISIPLTDASATRLGLPNGDILLTPGSCSGGSYSGPIDLISAGTTFSSQEAAELFGSGEAVIDLQNIGGSMTFGYPGSAITNDFSASLISADGSESMGARVMKADCERHGPAVPEPATVGLLLIGLALIMPRVLRRSEQAAVKIRNDSGCGR